jgi:hypothetical protein
MFKTMLTGIHGEVSNMTKFISSFIAATAIAAVSVSSLSTAQAHDFHKRHHHKKVVQNNNNHNNAVVWGIIGLAAGAIIANGAHQNQKRQKVYTQPKVHPTYPGSTYYPTAPSSNTYYNNQQKAYRNSKRRARNNSYGVSSSRSYEPWSQNWYQYCDRKYRSFNANTGTFRGYDGKDHFCVVR